MKRSHLIDSRFRSALPRFGGLFLATEFSSGLKAAAICCWRERAGMIETKPRSPRRGFFLRTKRRGQLSASGPTPPGARLAMEGATMIGRTSDWKGEPGVSNCPGYGSATPSPSGRLDLHRAVGAVRGTSPEDNDLQVFNGIQEFRDEIYRSQPSKRIVMVRHWKNEARTSHL